MIVTRTVLASLLLLSLGCREIPLTRQSAPLPESADLYRFEGRWYDRTGRLIGILHTGRDPRLDFWLPAFHCPCTLEDASLRNDELLFSVWADRRSKPVQISFKLVNENRAVVNQVPPEPGDGLYFVCGRSRIVFPTVLVRNPPSTWVARARTEKVAEVATEIGREAHDAVFDWLARRL